MNNTSTNKDLRVLSLFSGCGGMDLGFEGGFQVLSASVNQYLTPHFIDQVGENGLLRLKETRFLTVFANDILKDARTAWTRHFAARGRDPGVFYPESIVDLVKAAKNGNNVFPANIDVVTGGFPCQDFSLAGKRRGFNSRRSHVGEYIEETGASAETRGQLYIWMKEVVEITRPKLFLAENVKGLVNLSNVKEIIQNDFSSAGNDGYIVLNPRVLQAADYGVPQSRERVIFIGIRKSALKKSALLALSRDIVPPAYDPYPSPTHAYQGKGKGLQDFVRLKEVFQLPAEPEISRDPSQQYYSRAKYMGPHCQGQTEVKPGGIGPTIRSEHHGNIEFRRLATIHGGKISDELEQGMIERRLTPRECGLIQSFPPDYEFVIKNEAARKGSFLISPSQAYKIIGNAVPPLLAYHLARRIEALWPLYFKP